MDSNLNSYIVRGGSFWDPVDYYHVCCRGTAHSYSTNVNHGFRTMLYIK